MMPMNMNSGNIQKMMVTPKMLLSMYALQLNIMDLRMFMRAELEENPLLEEEEKEDLLSEDENKLNEKFSMLTDDEREKTSPPVNEEGYNISEEKRRYLESVITEKESLYQHLYWQLEVLARDDEEIRIGKFIIGNLDDNGFLNMEMERMRESINADMNSFRRALKLIRTFDPAGIAARNLKESLLIQLFLSGKGNTHLCRIVYSHLEDLERRYYKKIADALSITLKEVEKAKKRIAYLNPKPGASFAKEESLLMIEPDVFLNKKNGIYSVEVSEQGLPKLTVNKYYKSILKDKNIPEKTKEYIKKKFTSALWFIGALHQRKKTIARTCEYLVNVQKDFLENDVVKPLTLKEAADGLSISEATVSRAVSNKYAQMRNRLIELKSFFAGKLKTIDGRIISDRSVKQKIQDFVEAEDFNNQLSDKTITSLLNKEGIEISRRTVAKYRKSLDILPSRSRMKNESSSAVASAEEDNYRGNV